MSSIVIQSYREYDVPVWMQLCMNSVRRLCELRNWDYKFEGDEFLYRTPQELWCSNLWATTDFSRLVWLRECLYTYDVAIWFDADVYVFRPSLLNTETINGYAFAHELLSYKYHSINNAVMIFEKRAIPILDMYISKAREAFATADSDRTALGPTLLRQESNLLHGIGLFTANMMVSIANGDLYPLHAYESQTGNTLSCANLCHFMRDKTKPSARFLFDEMYKTAIENLGAIS